MVEKTFNSRRTSTKGFESSYPFATRFKTINGHTMHYVDQGHGRPVLMVHGNPTWSFYFRNIITVLSPEFRTIVPDHIGCGFSDKPGAKEYTYTLSRRVQDLDALINTLDISGPMDLVVHDWGGMIGLAWAVDHPERIRRIVITNTSGFFLPKEKRFPWQLALIKYLPFFMAPAVQGLNLFARGAVYLGSERPLTMAAKKGLLAPYNSWKNRIATLKFVQDIPISQKDAGYDIVDHVQDRLDIFDPSQIMFLWGARDFVFDLTFFNEFKRRFPAAESHIFEDAGHYLFEDKPEETARLITSFFKR